MTGNPKVSQAGRYRDVLQIREYRRLLLAFVIDATGGWAYNVVLLLYVFERTNSTLMLSLASIVRFAPALVLGPVGGLIADRYDRVRVMIVSALLAACTMTAMAATVLVDGPIWLLLVLSGLTVVVISPYPPAAGAMRVEVVAEKDLVAANALFSVLECLTVIIGPVLGALLLLLSEPAWAFVINAASYAIAAGIVSLVNVRSKGSAERGDEPFRTQVAAGMVTIWKEPVARTLVLFVALDSAVYGATTVLYVPLAADFGESGKGVGYLLASFALGGLLISFVVNRLAARQRLAPVVLGGMLLLALPFAFTVLTHSLLVGLALQVVAGAGMVIVDVLGITALQRGVERGVLSRALGALDTLAIGGILLGNLAMVPLMKLGGLPLALSVLAGVITVATVAGIRTLVLADAASSAQIAELTPRIQLLEALDIFVGAPYPVLERLAASVEVVAAEQGTVLMRQGASADALWIVVNGAVEVSARSGDGTVRVVSALGAHSYVGEIGLLQRIPRTATVTTAAPSLLWRIPAEEFFSALNEAPVSASFRAVSRSRLVQLVDVPASRQPADQAYVQEPWVR